MFSLQINFFSWFSVIFLSIVIYFVYFVVADFVEFFKIFKTSYAVITSPLFFLVVFLVCGIGIGVDVFYRAMEKEKETPLYLLYRSLMKRREGEKKVKGFDNIVFHLNRQLKKKEAK